MPRGTREKQGKGGRRGRGREKRARRVRPKGRRREYEAGGRRACALQAAHRQATNILRGILAPGTPRGRTIVRGPCYMEWRRAATLAGRTRRTCRSTLPRRARTDSGRLPASRPAQGRHGAAAPLRPAQLPASALAGGDAKGAFPADSSGLSISAYRGLHAKPYQQGCRVQGHGPEGRLRPAPYEGVRQPGPEYQADEGIRIDGEWESSAQSGLEHPDTTTKAVRQ